MLRREVLGFQEAVRLICARYGGTWRDHLPGKILLPESARCTVVADQVAFAQTVGRSHVLNDNITAIDLGRYHHWSTVGAQWGDRRGVH
jgi:hypothetical protein